MENKFNIRCMKCKWYKLTTGLSEDLKDLYEIKNHCTNCGKPREFRCPKCGTPSKMLRLKN